MKKQYDVVIIGAGVVGSAIARELSRYKLSIAVLEKNLDVCNETSGRNSAVVHGGFANPIGSLDVYKRQPVRWAQTGSFCRGSAFGAQRGNAPVSYTHLDVYKRQV